MSEFILKSHDLRISPLFQLVAEEGGFDIVCRERRWTKIAVQMGFAPGKAVGSHLRGHYEKILYPYNLFQNGTNLLVSWTPASQWHNVSGLFLDTNYLSLPSILSH